MMSSPAAFASFAAWEGIVGRQSLENVREIRWMERADPPLQFGVVLAALQDIGDPAASGILSAGQRLERAVVFEAARRSRRRSRED
jgi:hypothetical protein